jgi:hypothetical protein
MLWTHIWHWDVRYTLQCSREFPVLQISTMFQKVAVCKFVGLHFHVDTYVRVSAMSTTENMKSSGVLSHVRGEERCFMSEDNCYCLNWRCRKNTADMHMGLTQFPSPSLWHTVDSYSTGLYVWDLSWTPQSLKMEAQITFRTLTTLHSVTSQNVKAQRSLITEPDGTVSHPSRLRR